MRRLSVESTPIRTQVDILTKPATVEAAGAPSKIAGVKGRERFTKTVEIQTQTRTALSKDLQGLLANPNVRRSGCRCPDRYDADPNPDGPRCKSRFCVRKRAKKEIGKKQMSLEVKYPN
jgi:hypothetical protein